MNNEYEEQLAEANSYSVFFQRQQKAADVQRRHEGLRTAVAG